MARKHPAFGARRDYPKIDIYYDGEYVATTTWSRTVREAEERFVEAYPERDPAKVRARRQH
jgi:hypothetical protein